MADAGGVNKWTCKTCPYEYPIERNVRICSAELGDWASGADFLGMALLNSTLNELISRERRSTTSSAGRTAGPTSIQWLVRCFSPALFSLRPAARPLLPLPLIPSAELRAPKADPTPLAPTSTVDCKKECGADRAFYMQLQIRSADEPSTTFFRCAFLFLPFVVELTICQTHRCCNPKCAFQWRED